MQNTPRVSHGEVLCKADLHNLPRKCVQCSTRVNIEVRASQTHVCMCKWGGRIYKGAKSDP